MFHLEDSNDSKKKQANSEHVPCAMIAFYMEMQGK